MKRLAKKFAQIFFGVESDEEMKEKGLILSLAVPAFQGFDWLMVGVTGALVVALKSWGLSDWRIFIFLWVGNIALSSIEVMLSDKVRVDFTLMKGLRRLINAAIAKSWRNGIILEIMVLIRLLVWDGPACFLIFIRERLGLGGIGLAVLVLASGVQMAVWTFIYSLGYESILGAIKALF